MFGVLDAAAMLAAGRCSAVELADACLEQIERCNGGPPTFDGAPGAVNAWARIYPELARSGARAADARRAGGEVPPLCGVPLGVKDLYGIAGLPLTASSRVLEGNVAGADAEVVRRLREHGLVLLGHTHTHEFAAGGTTDQVGNPRDLRLIAGGSSGGNAAAVAAGMAPAAIGTDTCGSLRIPSACCGTSAIKPAHGALPIEGIVPLAPTLDHPGPMARTVGDCAALLSAMGGGALPTSPREDPRPLAGTTIALLVREPLDAAVASSLDNARSACQALGARVVERSAPWSPSWEDLGAILLTETWRHHRIYEERRHLYRPAIAELVEAARAFSDAGAYAAAQRRRSAGAVRWEEWFEEHGVDAVLEPTLPILPYERGPGYERGHAGGPGDPLIALTALWDMTRSPVVSLPVSWNTGISLIAPPGRERELVQVGIDLQEHALGVPDPGSVSDHLG